MSEFGVPSAKYGPLAHQMFEKGTARRLPLSGGMELTHRCNLACVHCYVNLPPGDREARARELTTAEVCGVIDQLVEAGNLWLTFTGGDPLLRPDFAEIYTHAWHKGLLLGVYTNATMITPKIIELWENHPPLSVEITQYGYSQPVYDEVTALKGAHKKFEKGIELLRQSKITWDLKAMVLKQNQHEIMAIKKHATDLGVGFRFDVMINPRIDGGKGPLAHRLSPAEAAHFDAIDEDRQEMWREYCEPRWGQSTSEKKYQCGAGHSTFLIDPYGRMHMCELSRRPGYDLRKGSFREGWYEALPKLREEKRDPDRGCSSCSAHSVCGQCTGVAELEGMIDQEPNLYLCEVADERLEILKAPEHIRAQGLIQIRRVAGPRAAPAAVPEP